MAVYTSPTGHTYLTDGSTQTVSGFEVGADKGTQMKSTFKAGDPTPFYRFGIPGSTTSQTTLSQPMTQSQADLLNRMVSLGATLTKYEGSGGNYSLDLPPNWVDGVNDMSEVYALTGPNSTDGGPSTGTVGALLLRNGMVTPDREISVGMNSGVPYGDAEIDMARRALAKFNGGFKAGDPKEYQQGAYATDMKMTQADADAMNQKYSQYINAGKPGSVSTGSGPASSTTPTGSSGTTGATGSSSKATPGQTSDPGLQAALDILKNSGLDAGTLALYNEVVRTWDPGQQATFSNVINKFKEISQNTIDPYFQEQADVFIKEMQRAKTYTETQQAVARESEAAQNQADLDATRLNLEKSGLTMTGEGVNMLGAKSAYAQAGTPEAAQSAMPVQQPVGGRFAEGLLPQSQRLMATSNEAKRQKELQDLQANVEQQLGSTAAQQAGFTPVIGNVDKTATLPGEQQQAKASTLSSLWSQAQDNNEQSKNINLFS